MTALVAVMNKMAVALAADSAVTIGNKDGTKIYNTVNKLFTLSKYQPVGIMIYGQSQLMEIPWEAIIKIYRQELGTTSFNCLVDYAEDFIRFLDNGNRLFIRDCQERYVQLDVEGYLGYLRNLVDKQVKVVDEEENGITRKRILQIVKDVILQESSNMRTHKKLPSLPRHHLAKVKRLYGALINDTIRSTFEKIPLTAVLKDKIRWLCSSLYYRDRFSRAVSGVVIAGFGTSDTFPGLRSYEVQAVVADRIKYRVVSDKQISRGETTAGIFPFAQRNAVDAFLTGVDPSFNDLSRAYLTHTFEILKDHLSKIITASSGKSGRKTADEVGKLIDHLLQKYQEKTDEHRRKELVDPMLAAVNVLPKDQLAEMAETLVSLTSFKKRISMGEETVGGPIDVAVLSKGDGFIWIKRKHYFDRDHNHRYFANYFDENKGPEGAKKQGRKRAR